MVDITFSESELDWIELTQSTAFCIISNIQGRAGFFKQNWMIFSFYMHSGIKSPRTSGFYQFKFVVWVIHHQINSLFYLCFTKIWKYFLVLWISHYEMVDITFSESELDWIELTQSTAFCIISNIQGRAGFLKPNI